MRKVLLLIIIVGMLAGGYYLLKDAPPTVAEPRVADLDSLRQTNQGPVIGFADKYNTQAWLGIPFASAPQGGLRWRAPQPPAGWRDVRAALNFGQPCVQYWGPMSGLPGKEGEVVGSEDCLYLNIWAPEATADTLPQNSDRLPVMVWIHGGGNSIGTGNSYAGHHLAGGQQVVYVAINYRLGVLGWFGHPALREGAANLEDASGNYGTLDMIAALRWVQENIANFGGDPNNVTIFGESAGGVNVYALLGSPLAKGLFHKAISQSGSARTITRAEAENLASMPIKGMANSSGEILAALQLQPDTTTDGTVGKVNVNQSQAEIAAYLRSRTATQLLSVIPVANYGMYRTPAQIRDGYVLPDESLLQRFRDPASYNSVPIMLGSNRDENKTFMAGDTTLVARWFGVIPRIRDVAVYNQFAAYYSDQWRALAVEEPAAILNSSQGDNVFTYRFDWDESPANWLFDLATLLGAGHGLEVSFVLGDFEGGISAPQIFDKNSEPGRLALSSSMMNYWGEFAYTGAPGRGRDGQQPAWTPWQPTGTRVMLLDTIAAGGPRMSDSAMTAAMLKERLAADLRGGSLTAAQGCELYAQLFLISFQVTDFWKAEEYAAFGDQGCNEYDPYSFKER